MLFNFLRIGLRNLIKHKYQSLILIGGLAAGMAACILLLQYVNYELSFDQFHKKGDRIYRIVNERFQGGKSVQKGTITYPTIGPVMKEEFPEVRNASRIAYSSDVMVTIGEKVEPVEPGLWVDQHFFEIFDYKLLASDGPIILDEPNEVLLTEELANRLYPGINQDYESLIGREIMLDRYAEPFKIVAVSESVPLNSSIQFEILTSYASCIRYWGEAADNSWQWSDFYHYLELQPGASPDQLEAKFAAFSERHFRGSEVSGSEEVFTLQPFTSAHLYSSGLEYEIGRTSNGSAVWALLIIAFFILLIAWINYVNLSTVRSMERAKEVGIRKVVGASRSQLIRQFFLETFLVNIISLFCALVLVQLLSPWFSGNFGISKGTLSFYSESIVDYNIWIFLFALIAGGVLVSGAYPAWLLSAPQVSGVLKGVFTRSNISIVLRKGLVVFQFAASIALIALVILVSRQIRFMSSRDLGIQIDQIVTINSPEMTQWDSTFIDRMDALKGELQQIPGVLGAATSSRAPGDPMGRVFHIQKLGEVESGQTFTSNIINVDFSYAETYGLKPVAGRFFRKTDHHNDFNLIQNIVVSEATIRMLGYANAQDATGQQIRFGNKDWNIIGVLPDFHQRSLQHAIEPIIFVPTYSPGNLLSLKINTGNIAKTLDQVKAIYLDLFPGNTFQFNFLEDSFSQLYASELRFSHILSFFTILTIIIASLGLFGLASYTTVLRRKEVGIRKVLGATSIGLVTLLNSEFMRLIIIAILIALPVAWYLMKIWLQDFAYHIHIEWGLFALTAVLAFMIASLAVSFHSVKAVMANPVESLRNE